jgi:hypothetical protein
MLRARRLSAVRICVPIFSVVLLGATAIVLTASAYSFQAVSSAASASRSYRTASARASQRGVPRRGSTGRKSSSSKQAKCVASTRGGRHRKAGKSCAGKKSKAIAVKPNVTPTRSGSESPSSRSVAYTAPQTQANGSALPAGVSEAPGAGESEAPGTEAGSPPAPTGSSPGEPVGLEEPALVSEPDAPGAPAAPFRFFSPSSFWNEALPANAPLDPSSAELVGALDEEVAHEQQIKTGPWINTTHASVPIYTVPSGQATVAVALDNALEPALSAAWSEVPLPSTAQPAAGSDGDLVVWQPSTDRLWEFWRLVHNANGWSATWGGAMRHVSTNPGVYGPEAWPGAQPGWGVSATSLSIAGGLITLEDLQSGQINHALAIAIPDVRAGIYASPANRTDGRSNSPLSLPEGAHLRLGPNLDLAALHLPRLTLMMAEAAQRYGIVIRDYAPNISFVAQDPVPTGTEPYTGPTGYFEGEQPSQLLATFPWHHLQLLKMSLHG